MREDDIDVPLLLQLVNLLSKLHHILVLHPTWLCNGQAGILSNCVWNIVCDLVQQQQ